MISGSAEQLQAILETAVEGIISIESDGTILFANASTERLFGYTHEEMVGQNVSMLMPDPDASAHDEYLKSYLETGNAKIIGIGREIIGLRKDGTTFPANLAVSEVIVDGKTTFTGFIRDVSEQHAMQEKTAVGEQRFQRSLSFANIGAWNWNIQTGELHWSNRIGPLFGYEVGELETTYDNFVNAVHPDDREKVTNAVNAAVQDGEDYYIEHRVVWPDGTVRWVLERGDVARDEDGAPINMLGIVEDITDIKENEEILRKAIRDADNANRVKSEFLSSMSHELRTPLNAIIGFSQLLPMDPNSTLTEHQEENVRNIATAGQHLLGLINDVLEFAKMEAGAVSVTLESVSVTGVIAEAMDMVASHAARRNITMDPDESIISKDRYVRADTTRLKQCLSNLLSNAVKYNNENGTVRVEIEDVENDELEIRVIDNGPGISKDKQQDVFVPFSRLGQEETNIEGAGIGLSITQKLVSLMRGKIGFTSTPGEGSTFWIRMPAATDANIRSEAGSKKEELRQTISDMESNTFSILYVEDNPANMEVMRQIIDMLPGGELIMANNAELGISFAEDQQPDMIIMDINLPGMDGIQGLEALRNNPATSHIPVVALSASAMPSDVKRGISAGFEAYLTKPVQVIEVLDVIKNTLELE